MLNQLPFSHLSRLIADLALSFAVNAAAKRLTSPPIITNFNRL
jgi:hypothetical protein